MNGRTKTFAITHLRCEKDLIVEAKGRNGFWPLRRPVRFRVGANCDSITAKDGRLLVHRNGALIGEADLNHPGALRWAWLLHPRHSSESPKDRAPRA
jgi:hypothetical protein